jgi:TrpR-related protein YerC/YecD
MTVGRDDWRTDDLDRLFEAILRLDDVPEAETFFRDLCTLGELRDMAQRWAVVRQLDAGMHYADISRRTGASTATITRIASWLHHGEGGYQRMLDRTKRTAEAEPTAERTAERTPEMGDRGAASSKTGSRA